MSQQQKEPSDSHNYSTVMLRVETLQEFIRALQPYLEDLSALVQATRFSFGHIVSDEATADLPEAREAERVRRILEYLRKHVQEADGGGSNPHALAFMSISHGTVRLIKAAVLERVADLKGRREAVASGGGLAAEAIEVADLAIARLESQVSTGVFAEATSATLVTTTHAEVSPPKASESPMPGNGGRTPTVHTPIGLAVE